ncbi:MAG: hypothetical protein JWR85_2309 [Marmoricola sp.]|nr:hypothetical protein [Marmoricola sp.]
MVADALFSVIETMLCGRRYVDLMYTAGALCHS